MKAKKFIAMMLVLFLAGISGAWAYHDGWHGRVGVYIGGPVWGPVWYPPPYYYPPQVIVVPPAQPTVYIEQQQQEAEPAAPTAGAHQYWYFCKSAKGYYPYVKECPEAWQKVLPQPEK